MTGIEFASEDMTPLRLVCGFPPDLKFHSLSLSLPLSGSLCVEGYLSTFIPQLTETTSLRVLLMESSSQVKIRSVGIMFYVMGLQFVGLCFCCPSPQISMLGFCCGTCELDSITRSLTFARPTALFPTLKLGVGGETTSQTPRCHVFTCELDSTHCITFFNKE